MAQAEQVESEAALAAAAPAPAPAPAAAAAAAKEVECPEGNNDSSQHRPLREIATAFVPLQRRLQQQHQQQQQRQQHKQQTQKQEEEAEDHCPAGRESGAEAAVLAEPGVLVAGVAGMEAAQGGGYEGELDGEADGGGGAVLQLASFAAACDKLCVLFSLLGMAFAFAGRDYVDKVRDLTSAAASFSTVEAMVDADVASGRLRVRGSHARNLLRVCRGLDLNRRLFQSLLSDSFQSLRASAGEAYEAVFSRHHSWAIRSVVAAGLLALPSAHHFLAQLHEDGDSWRQPATEFVASVGPVITHVEAIFTSRGLGIDW